MKNAIAFVVGLALMSLIPLSFIIDKIPSMLGIAIFMVFLSAVIKIKSSGNLGKTLDHTFGGLSTVFFELAFLQARVLSSLGWNFLILFLMFISALNSFKKATMYFGLWLEEKKKEIAK